MKKIFFKGCDNSIKCINCKNFYLGLTGINKKCIIPDPGDKWNEHKQRMLDAI